MSPTDASAPSPPFSTIPVYVPPMGARPPFQPTGLTAMMRSSRDLLSNLPVDAFLWHTKTWDFFGRKIHLFNAPDLVREVFVARNAAFERKSPQQLTAFEPLIGDGLLVSDGETWRHRRAAVGPIVHGRNVPAFVPGMVEAALEWRARWQLFADAGRPVDVVHEMGCLTAEIISRSIFGRTLGIEHTGEIAAAFARYQEVADQLALAEMLRLPSWVPRPGRLGPAREARRIHRIIDAIIDDRIEARSGGDGDEGCLIDRLFDAKDETGRPLDREAIRNEAMVIFLAGHETTANTLSWAFFLLSQAGWARAALHAEVDEALAGGPPDNAGIAALTYTRAVVEETLRLYPPIPLIAREAVEDATVGDTHVAKGSLVLALPWLIHRHPHLWWRAPDFIPERFLPGETRPRKDQYLPFALGPRVCPGMTFGLVEATLCLAVLSHAFELEPLQGTRVEPVCRLTLKPGNSLPMMVRARRQEAGAAA